jgi:hypothetical protein
VTVRIATAVLVVLSGMATRYDYAEHAGQPLRCGGTYTVTEQWVSADVDAGPFRCGELLAICAAGECRVLPVRDSGPLSRFCVMDGDECRDILVDVPQHVATGWWNGLSARARVMSVTRAQERLELER